MWDLPGPGLEPMCPALAGGFLTTEPPGKPAAELFVTLHAEFFSSFTKDCPLSRSGILDLCINATGQNDHKHVHYIG